MKVQDEERGIGRATWPSSLASLTVDFVAETLDKMLSPSTCSRHYEDTLALFDRDEISVGKQLGKGGFSNVYEIKSFRSESSAKRKSWTTANQMIIRSYYRENAANQYDGKSNYVLKHLKPSLMTTPKAFQMAAVDLAVEAHFLSSFRHPHILKLRGIAGDGIEAYKSGQHDGYFLIFDRLQETLEERLEKWRRQDDLNQHESFSALVERMKAATINHDPHGGDYSEPLKYASQIASALAYMHERDIIYRDLKPSNCGINAHGDIQIFDMGFTRQLPASVVRDLDSTYNMTGRIGTLRYMSPENALYKPYNLKSDVYSWSILFWELLSLEMPYHSLTRERFLVNVCKRGKRHRLNHSWPKPVRDLIQRSWSERISVRPTMDEVCSILESIQQKEEPRKRTRSIVLELPPSFEIENRELGNGTKSTATSVTRESSTVVTQQRLSV
jgi:serine/threonine protein kinase